jgi:molybdopterin-biosynthesis enzyme MoeA-like protein
VGFGLIIIGDEILSGKRQDKHFAKVLELFQARGLSLDWVNYLGDDRERCMAMMRQSFASGDVVFSCGGIGATPDDHTRQSAAAALGLPLQLHPEARELISQRTAQMAQEKGDLSKADMTLPENLQRLKMGEFPVGCSIIPNPFNKIPGFAIANHYFVPGFPVMAWPMIEWVLDTHYSHLFNAAQPMELAMWVFEIGEADATPIMETVEREFPGIKVFSLPSVGEAGVAQGRRHIELGVKGSISSQGSEEQVYRLNQAFAMLKQGVIALGAPVEPKGARGTVEN